MPDILATICRKKLEWIATAKTRRSESQLMAEVKTASRPRGFTIALDRAVSNSGTGLIAELKKASPSKGLIRTDFIPSVLASDYQTGGAACLSVLTDKPYFHGDSSYLIAARNAVSLPILRKDFILDPYQIIESLAIGSDCILIIRAAIVDSQAEELSACARELEMDLLIEIHNESELERALKMPPALLGINNRNLKTLEVNLATTERLCPQVPSGWTIVSESGIYSPDDIARIKQLGVHRFLVGESLMRERDLVAATQNLLSIPTQNDITL
ncbi:MAG: indole-3-glycerol phosphate synthase TrpC [Alphaproteobacteria bacterium]